MILTKREIVDLLAGRNDKTRIGLRVMKSIRLAMKNGATRTRRENPLRTRIAVLRLISLSRTMNQHPPLILSPFSRLLSQRLP